MLDERRQSPQAWRSYLHGSRASPARAALVRPRGVPRGVAAPIAGPGSGAGCCAAWIACAGGWRRCRCRRGRADRGLRAGGVDRGRGARVRARGGCLSVRRATTSEVQWLLRRAACRGLGEPGLDALWRPAAVMVETSGRAAGLRAAGDRSGSPRERADRRGGPRAGGRLAGGPLLSGAAGGRRAARGGGVPGSAELLCSPLEAVELPGGLRAARALDRQSRGVHARAPADRRCRQRVRRAADLRARAAVVYGGGEPSARARARRLPAVPRAPAAAARRDLAGRRRAVARGARAPRAGAAHHFGTVDVHRPLGLQPALFLDHLPRADGGRVARLRRRVDDRAVRRADGDRHARRRLRARRAHRAHRDRWAAAGEVRHHRGVAHRAAAVDPARGDAWVGQDDRRRAAGVAGRAARQRRRRRRPQARPQPRGPPGAAPGACT